MTGVAFNAVPSERGRQTPQQPSWPRHLGDLVDSEMKKRDWSQEETARYFGVAQSSIARWIDGSSKPRGARLRKIAEFCDIDVAYAFQLNFRIPVGEINDTTRLAARLDAIEARIDDIVDGQKEMRSELRVLKEALAMLLDRIKGAKDRAERRLR